MNALRASFILPFGLLIASTGLAPSAFGGPPAAVAPAAPGVPTSTVHADEAIPPWNDPGDVPVPSWARSVAPNRAESAIYVEPGKLDVRRGSAQPGARLPFFGTRRAAGCQGRWLNVGPLAWMCSDVADFTADDAESPALGARPWVTQTGDGSRPQRPGARGLPSIMPSSATDDGLPYRYYFAARDGAFGFVNLASALDDAPDQELEPGFAVAVLEEQAAHGVKWGKTKKGRWVAMRELIPVRPFLFRGEAVEGGKLDMAWVVSDKASIYPTEKPERSAGTRPRFERMRVLDERPGKDGGMVRVESTTENQRTAPVWMKAKDLSRPRAVAPPAEVPADSADRWIDIDIAQQTLVAYEGQKPVFATIVSTGKGAPGSGFETRKGVHRIWVKIFTTKMDNLDKEEVERHYAIEDVPWVQFFDNAIALHGAFWHRNFGRVHSHGCVNLAPLDARWLFAFTGPHLPAGWTAVLPTKIEQGTVVRVR
jgi:lipoprotein-anchoring transpeptidase ErfK/SrfK